MIENISQKQGRKNPFAEETKEIQTLIKIAGSSKISAEDIENIKEKQAYEASINKRIDQLKEQKNTKSSTLPPIHNKETLITFLKKTEIETQKMEILSLKKNEFLTFSKGTYQGTNNISGTFQIVGQTFKTIKVNNQSRHYIQPKFIKGIINSLITETKTTPKTAQKKQINIPQNSNKAILEKTFIRELFDKDGIAISKQNTEALNTELTLFKITDAIIKGQSKFLKVSSICKL